MNRVVVNTKLKAKNTPTNHRLITTVGRSIKCYIQTLPQHLISINQLYAGQFHNYISLPINTRHKMVLVSARVVESQTINNK